MKPSKQRDNIFMARLVPCLDQYFLNLLVAPRFLPVDAPHLMHPGPCQPVQPHTFLPWLTHSPILMLPLFLLGWWPLLNWWRYLRIVCSSGGGGWRLFIIQQEGAQSDALVVLDYQHWVFSEEGLQLFDQQVLVIFAPFHVVAGTFELKLDHALEVRESLNQIAINVWLYTYPLLMIKFLTWSSYSAELSFITIP